MSVIAFRKHLKYGIFARSLTKAWGNERRDDYFVTYICKGRGVCPSCNTLRMVKTAANLNDHVCSRL
jgi:hypothetical protein